MIYNMYEPKGTSKIYLFIFLFFAVFVATSIIVYNKPLIIQNACSDMSLKMAGLSKNYNYNIDPESDFDYLKARCLEDALSPAK